MVLARSVCTVVNMLIPLISHPALGHDGPLPAELTALVAQLSLAGDVYLALPLQSRGERGAARLSPLLRSGRVRVGPFSASELEAAVTFLDSGAVAVVFDLNAAVDYAAPQLKVAVSVLPPHRVYVHARDGGVGGSVDSLTPTISSAIAVLRDGVAGFFVAPGGAGEVSSEYAKALRIAAGPDVSVALATAPGACSSAAVGRLHRAEVHVVAPAFVAGTPGEAEAEEGAMGGGRLDVGGCLVACSRSDRPDGLFATVVVDECGHALGLVYSNGASILEAIRCGRGVYYSRSRCVCGGGWAVGAEGGVSAHFLTLPPPLSAAGCGARGTHPARGSSC